MSEHETAQTVDLPVPPDLTGRADGLFSSLINRPLLPANSTEPPDRLGRPWRWAFAIRHRVDWLAVDRHHAVAMFSTSRYRPPHCPPSSSRCGAAPAHHRACAHRCGGAGRRNADRMAVGGRISEGPFVALISFVGRRADEETSGRRRRDGGWRLDRRPESRDGGPSPRIRGRSLVGQTPGQVNHRDVADGAGMTRSTRRDPLPPWCGADRG